MSTKDQKDEFDSDIYLDIVKVYPFEDLPVVFRRFITYRASAAAATQLVANPNLVRLLGQQASLQTDILLQCLNIYQNQIHLFDLL